MGLGVGLTLIAIGAILAFATDFDLAGIDIQLIGVILMLVGAAGIAFTMLYLRPRRVRASAVGVEEPVYEADVPHVHRDGYGNATPPHVHGETVRRTDPL